MSRSAIRLVSLFVIGVGAHLANPSEVLAMDPPTCATSTNSMCSPPPGFQLCFAFCENTSTGYLLECEYSPVCGDA